VTRALGDSGVAQWLKQYGIRESLVNKALNDGGIAQWLEPYWAVGYKCFDMYLQQHQVCWYILHWLIIEEADLHTQ